MPDEYRFLVFSPDEAVSALSTYAHRTARDLPAGRAVEAGPCGGTVVSGQLVIDDGASPPASVAFTGDEVLEALIGYCLAQRIPLPMVSQKTLERLHGRFALRIGHVDSIDMQMRTHTPRTD